MSVSELAKHFFTHLPISHRMTLIAELLKMHNITPLK